MPQALTTLDVQIVAFHPEGDELRVLLQSLVREQAASGVRLSVRIWDNSIDPAAREAVDALATQYQADFLLTVLRDGGNHGFGAGHNRLLVQATGTWLLLLNQDLQLDPGCLQELALAVLRDAEVAVWELRQRPYEHPKIYDPSWLDTSWFSGAAFMIRREAMQQVNGFDPRIFMYGEDVDLAWRLRAAGRRIAYLPRASVFHPTYRYAREVKPLQATESTLANLCLRARYGSWGDVCRGLALLGLELVQPPSFAGQRLALVRVGWRFLGKLPYFRRSGRTLRPKFRPCFLFRDYALHRDGAFHAFAAPLPAGEGPLVSVIVRTHNRPEVLREALLSLANQTYRNIEVVVVEDGAPAAQALVESDFASRLSVRYVATGDRVGRSAAGNLALSMAQGEWFNFLDDDDQLFADHVEVLLAVARREGKKGAYGLSWEVATRTLAKSPYRYEERSYETPLRQPFSRLKLWQDNYLPIQAVLFHRSLYERYGGFDTSMDQLEDWNLWTRYTLRDDFLLVEKTTSKYRVPDEPALRARRAAALRAAHEAAASKQAAMVLELSPRDVLGMADSYLRDQTICYLSRARLRSLLHETAGLRWIYHRRNLLRRIGKRLWRS